MTKNARTLAALALLLLSLCAPTTTAQERGDSGGRFDFYTRGPYRQQVPRPQTLLRYDVGDFHTNYAMMERVLDDIARAAPDRVRVFDIGLDQRVPDAARRRRLRAREHRAARRDQVQPQTPRGPAHDSRRRRRGDSPRTRRSTVWLQYTIHGNESASFEAMMQVLYQLAASDEPATLDILKNSVALINVCANPDGHERFVTWYNSFGVGDPNPSAAEHDEPWSVYGRVNRYRFDLNRDNIATSQVETKNMQRAYPRLEPAGRRRPSRPALAVLLPAGRAARQPEPAARADRALAHSLRPRQRRAVRPAQLGLLRPRHLRPLLPGLLGLLAGAERRDGDDLRDRLAAAGRGCGGGATTRRL